MPDLRKEANPCFVLLYISVLITGLVLYVLYCDNGCQFSISRRTCTNYNTYITKVSSYECHTGFYCDNGWVQRFVGYVLPHYHTITRLVI